MNGHLPTPLKSEVGKPLLAPVVGETKRGRREESAFLELSRATDILSRRLSAQRPLAVDENYLPGL
jgi:hypothetical protein